jgi:hypothetical protein
MCCSPSGFKESEINGECITCNGDTVDGEAYECCSYSPLDCKDCGARYCDQSC